jgi:hypothetical protein
MSGASLPVWVSTGRWGRRRVRTTECFAILRVEDLYSRYVVQGMTLPVGTTLESVQGSWWVKVEICPNAVWRLGRPMYRCGCGCRATRLYVPTEKSRPACRQCWGLTYSSRQENYKGLVLGRFSRSMLARMATQAERERNAPKNRARYEARRPFLLADLARLRS